MNLISNVVMLLALTSLTGGILTVAWCLILPVLKQNGNTSVIYGSLKLVALGYIVPVAGIAFWLASQCGDTRYAVFCTTPRIRFAAACILFIWLTGLLLTTVRRHKLVQETNQLLRQRYSATTREFRVLERVMKQQGMKREVSMYHSFGVLGPCVAGANKPGIFLPPREIQEEELEMMLTHELLHVKSEDNFWSRLFAVCCRIHWFNPLAWYTLKQMNYWAEVHCDELCSEQFGAKRYFRMILDMVTIAKADAVNGTISHSIGRTELGRRLRYAVNKASKKKSKFRTAVAVLLSAATLTGGVFCAYGANVCAAELYQTAFWSSTVDTEEELEIVELQEYTGTVDEFEGCTVTTDDNPVAAYSSGAFTFYDWELDNNEVRQGVLFYKAQGDQVVISGNVIPSTSRVQVGLVYTDGRTRYIYAKGGFSHTFSITEDDYYRVFVKNDSGASIEIALTYY